MRETEAATLMAILNDPAPPLRTLRPDVELILEQIVQKALAKDPKTRYQSAGELRDALEGWFKGRAGRPSSKDIGTWLTQLFGEERAKAKIQIARGTNLNTSVPAVMKAVSRANLPSGIIQLGTPHTPVVMEAATDAAADAIEADAAEPPPPQGRRVGMLGAFAAVVAVVVGGAVLATRPGAGAAASPIQEQARVSLAIESEPSGAFVFIGGEPTGRTTPVTLEGLSPGSTVMIRLEKTGFAPTRQDVVLGAAGLTSRHFELQQMTGRVVFRGLRASDSLMVDGAKISGAPLDLGIGAHSMQLVSNGNVIWSRSISVAAGEQTVDLPEQ
jgi:hypothetical protein